MRYIVDLLSSNDSYLKPSTKPNYRTMSNNLKNIDNKKTYKSETIHF